MTAVTAPSPPVGIAEPERRPRGAEAHCTLCGRFFTSDSGFDRHVRPVGCADPAYLRNRRSDPVFEVVERAGGPTWSAIHYDRNGERVQHLLSRSPSRQEGPRTPGGDLSLPTVTTSPSCAPVAGEKGKNP